MQSLTTVFFVGLTFVAMNAAICWFVWRSASKIRSQLSLQSAMVAIEDDVTRLLLMMRRIEGRQTGSMRSSMQSNQPPTVETMDKDQLRAHFGLRAGVPVKHT